MKGNSKKREKGSDDMKGEEFFIKLQDDIEIHAEVYEKGHPQWLIVTHGIGEHLGRHHYLKEILGSKFNLFFYDLRGHGLSMGEDAYIHDFQDYIEDLDQLLNYLRKRFRIERYSLFGHSMGALITSSYMQRKVSEDFYPEKVYLNAPPVGFGGPGGGIVKVAPHALFGALAKSPLSVRLGGLVDLNYLSHDPLVAQRYREDTRNHLTLHTKLILEMVKCSGETFNKPLNVNCSSYVSVGSGDKIVCPKSLIDYFTYIEKSFDLKVFDGAFHEIHNEIEKYRLPYFEHLKDCFLDYL